MPPDQQTGACKRRQKSHSFSIHRKDRVEIDPMGDTSISRNHGLSEEDPTAKGPNKSRTLRRGSEPPMRKNSTMNPRSKRKKPKKEIDNQKASRTSYHQALKNTVGELKLELQRAKQTCEETERKRQKALDELGDSNKNCIEQAEELRLQKQAVEAANQDNQSLRCKLKETSKSASFHWHELCRTRESLEIKDEATRSLKQQLENSKRQNGFLAESLAEMERKLKGKEDLMAAKQKELDDSTRQSTYLEELLNTEKLSVQTRDGVIATLQKHIDLINGSNAKLLAEKDFDLQGKDNLIADKQEKLDSSRLEFEQALRVRDQRDSDWCNELASRTEKLANTERDLDANKAAIEELKKERDSLREVNDNNGHANQLIRNREKKAKDELRSKETDHKKKTSQLESEKLSLQKSLAKLRSDMVILGEEKNQAIGTLQQTIKALRPQNQRHHDKEPDEKIKSDFAKLESNIRQFVDTIARPVTSATDEELKTAWPNWSPVLRNFLECPLLCNGIFEAYVWEYLLVRVFAPGSKVWAGGLGQSLEHTLFLAAREVEGVKPTRDLYIDFQYLRSSSSSLISRLNGADFRPKYFEQDVRKLTSGLANMCGLEEASNPMQDTARRIFKEARELEIQLRKLKPTYTFCMCKATPSGEKLKYGFQFSGEEMEDRSPGRRSMGPGHAPAVDFIMRPGLYKRGDSNGTKYEVMTCLIKMGVVCNSIDLLRNPTSSSSGRSSSTLTGQPQCTREFPEENEGRASQSLRRSSRNRGEEGSSSANPYHVEGELAGPDQHFQWQLSSPDLASPSTAPNKRKAARTHSQTGGESRGRGEGSSAKKRRLGTGHDDPDSDAEYKP